MRHFRLHRLVGVVLFVALLSATPALAEQPPQERPPTPEETGATALAERISELGQNMLRSKSIYPAHWTMSSILFEAAGKLNPKEPRYPALRAEAAIRAGDVDSAIDALNHYKSLDPYHVTVQTQLIDLYVGRMETTDAKVNYLQRVVGTDRVHPEVRSHAALLAARLFVERSQPEPAKAMIAQSLRMNPLNVQALTIYYNQVAAEGTPLERVRALLSLLRANPTQLWVMEALSGELVDAGLLSRAVEWYALGVTIAPKIGTQVSPEYAKNYAIALYLTGRNNVAMQVLDQLVQIDPDNTDAWMLRLLFSRGVQQAQVDVLRDQVHNVLMNKLAVIRNALGDTTATTRPITALKAELPNLAPDVAALQKQPDLVESYVATLTDLAWFHLYFNKDPKTATPIIETLKQLLNEGSVTTTRLEGWRFLLENKPEEAQVKLSAIAERDPLSALGLLVLSKEPDKTEPATRLLSANPGGVLGAYLFESLRDTGAQVAPNAVAATIQRESDQFPRDFLKILEEPEAFYVLRAEPLKVAHRYHEPMFANVVIQNISNYDLTIGRDGIIKPDLWFDAQLRGVAEGSFPGVAYQRMDQVMVLRPGMAVSRLVRIDQGELAQLMATNPQVALQIFATVMTNPVVTAGGTNVAPGTAGQLRQFSKFMERSSFPLAAEESRRRLFELADTGNAIDRIYAADLLGIFVRMFRASKDEQFRPIELDFQDRLHRLTSIEVAPVAAWTYYLAAQTAQPQQVASWIQRMANTQQWESQLLSMVAAQSLPPETQKELATFLVNAPDELVQRYAAAVLQFVEQAATQPTTSPTTQPATPTVPPAMGN